MRGTDPPQIECNALVPAGTADVLKMQKPFLRRKVIAELHKLGILLLMPKRRAIILRVPCTPSIGQTEYGYSKNESQHFYQTNFRSESHTYTEVELKSV